MVRQTPEVRLSRDAFIDLRTAFRQVDVTFECFLDTQSGRVIWCSDHTAPVDGELDGDAPGWMHASKRKRLEIWRDATGRYLEVPSADVETRWQDMQAFRRQADHDALENCFNGAPPNRRTIRRFGRWLQRHPQMSRTWQSFLNQRIEGRIRAWLRDHGMGLRIKGDVPP
jgi:hypothetical protein